MPVFLYPTWKIRKRKDGNVGSKAQECQLNKVYNWGNLIFYET